MTLSKSEKSQYVKASVEQASVEPTHDLECVLTHDTLLKV